MLILSYLASRIVPLFEFSLLIILHSSGKFSVFPPVQCPLRTIWISTSSHSNIQFLFGTFILIYWPKSQPRMTLYASLLSTTLSSKPTFNEFIRYMRFIHVLASTDLCFLALFRYWTYFSTASSSRSSMINSNLQVKNTAWVFPWVVLRIKSQSLRAVPLRHRLK